MKIFNKKISQISQNVMEYITKIPFTVIVVFSIIFMIGAFVLTDINISEASTKVYSQVFLFSEHGISYYDKEINRVYPLIIDISDLNKTEEKINEYIYFGENNNKFAARITYHIENYDLDKKEIYYNKQLFELLEPLNKLEGPGGSTLNKEIIPVTIMYNYEKYPGRITIEVVVPNE